MFGRFTATRRIAEAEAAAASALAPVEIPPAEAPSLQLVAELPRPEPNPEPRAAKTKAKAIDHPRNFLFTIEPLFSCLFVNADYYMTAWQSDALAAGHGWPTPEFRVQTLVGLSVCCRLKPVLGSVLFSPQVAQTASLLKLAACATPAKRARAARLCPCRR